MEPDLTIQEYFAGLSKADFSLPKSGLTDMSRVYIDELRRLAWGTDAGFCRLIPQLVVRSKSENEVAEILKAASLHNVPVTFRAAGTSLSGQAVSNSVLVVAGSKVNDHDKGTRDFNDPAYARKIVSQVF